LYIKHLNPIQTFKLGFDFDLLGRLRGYETDSRASTFNYNGNKRFDDYDADNKEMEAPSLVQIQVPCLRGRGEHLLDHPEHQRWCEINNLIRQGDEKITNTN